MERNIVVTGGSGMVGKALKLILPNAKYISSGDYDLTDPYENEQMFIDLKPNIIIHLAAIVGGIIDNINRPADYFYQNLMMNSMLIDNSRKYGVERFIGILSTCIYPDALEISKYPMSEEVLHEGPPTKTNFSYGYAKRCMGVQIDSYNKQYGLNYQYLIPCNLYGENDKIGENSHFVSALVEKIIKAKQNNDKSIELFGDGSPLRQFMYCGDLAEIIKYVILNDITESFNVSNDDNLTIEEIALKALKVSNNEDFKINFDTTKPNGQYRKDVSNSKLKNLIPDYKFTTLEDGLLKTFFWMENKL